MTAPIPNPWVPAVRIDAGKSWRLFCFPYAGGGASFYRRSSDQLPRFLDLIPVQLPGRENRLHEPPIDNLARLIDEAVRNLRPQLHPPFAFFGHSMGSLIAFEMCRKLRRLQWPCPEYLFVSAMRGPQLPCLHAPRHNLPEPALIREVRILGGTPGGVFENPELMELIVPTLRADFAICDLYEFSAERPLEIPICAFAGCDDPEAPPEMVHGWREQTFGRFSSYVMPGGHFFINSARQAVLDIVVSQLRSFSHCAPHALSEVERRELELKGEPA